MGIYILPKSRAGWLAALAASALAVILALAAACGSDGEPEPAPVQETEAPAAAQPAETVTEAPAPEPEPVAEAPAAQPDDVAVEEPAAAPDTSVAVGTASIEDLVLTSATTGADLVATLSEEEVSCIKGAVGDTFFQILLGTPIMAAASSGTGGAFFFNCLRLDSIVGLGVAFFDNEAGGWTPETRACVLAVAREHPDLVYTRLGLQPPEESVTNFAETHLYNLEIYDCMNNQEKMIFTVASWRGLDSLSQQTGADVVALLTAEEVACVQEALSEEELLAIAAATPLEAVAIGAQSAPCISEETNVAIAVAGFEWGIGDVSEEASACLVDFFREHPAYLQLLQTGLTDEFVASADPDEFIAIVDSGTAQYACLSPAELLQVSQAFTRALAQ